MNDQMQKNKQYMIVGAIVLVLLLIGGFIMFNKNRAGSNGNADKNVLPEVEILPTVDPSVKVTIEPDAKKQEVTLSITGVPKGTETIEYEFTYETLVDGELVPKGATSTIIYDGEDPVTREITLGTCSSGTCKYDKGITSIKIVLKFAGSYGARLFEKTYEI